MHRNLELHYLHCQGCPPFPIGWTPPHSPHSGEPTHYPHELLLPWCDSNAAGLQSYSLQTWNPTGNRNYVLDTDAWVSGVLLRKLPCIQGGAPMDTHSPLPCALSSLFRSIHEVWNISSTRKSHLVHSLRDPRADEEPVLLQLLM